MQHRLKASGTLNLKFLTVGLFLMFDYTQLRGLDCKIKKFRLSCEVHTNLIGKILSQDEAQNRLYWIR